MKWIKYSSSIVHAILVYIHQPPHCDRYLAVFILIFECTHYSSMFSVICGSIRLIKNFQVKDVPVFFYFLQHMLFLRMINISKHNANHLLQFLLMLICIGNRMVHECFSKLCKITRAYLFVQWRLIRCTCKFQLGSKEALHITVSNLHRTNHSAMLIWAFVSDLPLHPPDHFPVKFHLIVISF